MTLKVYRKNHLFLSRSLSPSHKTLCYITKNISTTQIITEIRKQRRKQSMIIIKTHSELYSEVYILYSYSKKKPVLHGGLGKQADKVLSYWRYTKWVGLNPRATIGPQVSKYYFGIFEAYTHHIEYFYKFFPFVLNLPEVGFLIFKKTEL